MSVRRRSWTDAKGEERSARVIGGDTFRLSRSLVKICLCGVVSPKRGTVGHYEVALCLPDGALR